MTVRHKLSLSWQFALIWALFTCVGSTPPTSSASSQSAAQTPSAAVARRLHVVPKFGLRPQIVQFPPHLRYYGGPVISNVGIEMVLYGTGTYLANVTGGASPTLMSFYQLIASSAHMDWLCEYDTSILDLYGQPGTDQTIGRGSWIGSTQIVPDPSRNGSTINDAQIQAELAAQIDAGHLPAPSVNTLYMIHFPVEKTILLPPSDTSCVTICGYHDSFLHNGAQIRYGVLPDMSGACATGCGGNTLFESLTSTAWHELIESVTDPDVNTSTAWYDTTEYSAGNQWGEIGDICLGDSVTILLGSGVAYFVQRLWSNAQVACAISGSSCAPTAVEGETPGSVAFALACANPVVGAARFRIGLPAPAHVDLSIFDVAGRREVDLLSADLTAGDHTLSWSPQAGGGALAGGVYFARLRTGGRAYARVFVFRR